MTFQWQWFYGADVLKSATRWLAAVVGQGKLLAPLLSD
eukprot:SAG31_NODE_7418_length_1693_cov_2.424090_1_plen_37_part_10